MKIIGIIPSRYASSRFPGKPLIDLKGKTMIQRVYEGVKKSDLFSDVIVATDDERIFKEVESFGGKVMMTSSVHRTGTDRCGEIAEKVEADVIINIQGDEPLIDVRQLEGLAKAFDDKEVSIATLGITCNTKDLANPNRIKLVKDKRNKALYFSRSFIPNIKNAKKEVVEKYNFLRHIGVYAYRKQTLLELVTLEKTLLEEIESLEQLRWMYHGYPIHVIETSIETPNIDTPEDVPEVLKMM